jgi:hypothetical protein
MNPLSNNIEFNPIERALKQGILEACAARPHDATSLIWPQSKRSLARSTRKLTEYVLEQLVKDGALERDAVGWYRLPSASPARDRQPTQPNTLVAP